MTDRESANGTESTEELRREIHETRAELGETVEALAAKLDVKQRLRDEADHVKASASAKAEEARHTAAAKASEPPVQLIAAVAVAVVLVLLVRRARR
jgi:hypothetical protein